MTIYEFILKHSTYGKQLFPDSLTLLKLKKMSDEEKIKFLKDYDKKNKPKRKYTRKKKVDNNEEKAYTDKTNGGKSEAKSVPRKRKRKTASKSTQD
tara:strand:- start:1193 stop:1480 length:288 start_codon:yes stop_codon:yes gene_type:complete